MTQSHLATVVMTTALSLASGIALAQSQKDVSQENQFKVIVTGRTIGIPSTDWTPLKNSEEFAVNFEAKAKQESEAWHQIVTIFKIPMAERDRQAVESAPLEYAEFFIVHPGHVTLQLRVDKGGYWLLSRQTFAAPEFLRSRVQEYRPFLSEEQNRLFLEIFDLEVKRTRFRLQQLLQ